MTDALCINTIRTLAADTVQKANSGHPGAPMGCAPIAHLLWSRLMSFNPRNPKWANRDRFVLSNGHACALQYVMLHLAGYNMSMDDLKSFRQLHSKTPGHPENYLTEGIECSTGPLAQGISNAVGMAIAESHLAALFNKPGFNVVDHNTWVICGDGCLMEGVASEACSLAGHLGLGKLTLFYDDNQITIDGSTGLHFTENVLARFEAYGWHTQRVVAGDAEDLTALSQAVQNAQQEKARPSIIAVKTTIGFGSSKQGTHHVHGAPLGADDVAKVKARFGFDPAQSFVVSDQVREVYGAVAQRGQQREAEWAEMFLRYKAEFPELASELQRRMEGRLPDNWRAALPQFPLDKPLATRQTSEVVLNALAGVIPDLMGGSADLNPSCLSYIKASGDYQKDTPAGRNIRFGVREHGMAAIMNGLALHGGVIPYGSTFLNFIGYAMGAVRMSALSHIRVFYIATHDSIGLGEDGPTHQPIEMMTQLRSLPNMLTFRPADGKETAGAYAVALENAHRPSTFALSRQSLPQLASTTIDGVAHGGYIVVDPPAGARPQLILVGTGSELHLCVNAAQKLQAEGVEVRVVSFVCWELFDEQPIEYRELVLPANIPALSVEAAAVTGWEKYVHASHGMRSYGASGPLAAVLGEFGFTVDGVVGKARQVLDFYRTRPIPDLIHRPF